MKLCLHVVGRTELLPWIESHRSPVLLGQACDSKPFTAGFVQNPKKSGLNR